MKLSKVKQQLFLVLLIIFWSAVSLGSNLPYIPRAALFTPPDVIAIKISPNSNYLAYVKSDPSGVMNIFVRKNQPNQKLQQLTYFTSPEIYRFFWTGDSKHIVFVKDTNGSKAFQLYSLEVKSGILKNPTQNFKNISAKIFKINGDKVAVGINDRNINYHDVFILDTSKNTLTRIFKNNLYSRFTFDETLKIVLKERIHEDGSIDIYKGKRVYLHFSAEDAFHSQIVLLKNSIIYFLDSRNSDTTWLKSIDLNTGKQKNLAHNVKSDIDDIIFTDNNPIFYSTTWLKKEWHKLGIENIDSLQKIIGVNFEITNQNDNYWIVRAYNQNRIGASFYLYNLKTRKLESLFLAKSYPNLPITFPFEFKTRDGLLLTAYLTLPSGVKSFAELNNPVPLIVFPHGGPFQVRDSLNFNADSLWLASRGYAVLLVNFRLSSGLGKNLVNAGNQEWGGKANFDLIDGAQWCINKGIAAKSKIGIMGGSYGGYATLSALAFTPKFFAVGVSIAGPSSLITVMRKIPRYWDFPAYLLSDKELFFTKGAFIKSMGGTPETSEGLKFLASRSPLNFADKIERPLLLIQGDHDPIVTKQEAQQIFNVLKKLHKRVRLISFADEGHHFMRYANLEVLLGNSEKWLHDVLGGQYEPLQTSLVKKSQVTIQDN